MTHKCHVPRSFAAFRMTMKAGRKSRKAGSFPRKELGEALRNTENLRRDLTPLSFVASGATSFLWKEALALRHAAMETQRLVP